MRDAIIRLLLVSEYSLVYIMWCLHARVRHKLSVLACSCMVYDSVCGKLAFRNLPLLVNECQVCSVWSGRSVCSVSFFSQSGRSVECAPPQDRASV
jgi:hypothetical protein